MAEAATLGRVDVGEVDAQLPGAGADGRAREDLGLRARLGNASFDKLRTSGRGFRLGFRFRHVGRSGRTRWRRSRRRRDPFLDRFRPPFLNRVRHKVRSS